MRCQMSARFDEFVHRPEVDGYRESFGAPFAGSAARSYGSVTGDGAAGESLGSRPLLTSGAGVEAAGTSDGLGETGERLVTVVVVSVGTGCPGAGRPHAGFLGPSHHGGDGRRGRCVWLPPHRGPGSCAPSPLR